MTTNDNTSVVTEINTQGFYIQSKPEVKPMISLGQILYELIRHNIKPVSSCQVSDSVRKAAQLVYNLMFHTGLTAEQSCGWLNETTEQPNLLAWKNKMQPWFMNSELLFMNSTWSEIDN